MNDKLKLKILLNKIDENPYAFDYLPNKLKNNKEIILRTTKSIINNISDYNTYILNHFLEEIDDNTFIDEEFVLNILDIVSINYSLLTDIYYSLLRINYKEDNFFKSKSFTIKLLSKYPFIYYAIPSYYKDDKDIINTINSFKWNNKNEYNKINYYLENEMEDLIASSDKYNITNNNIRKYYKKYIIK